jgi:hypothetical protein
VQPARFISRLTFALNSVQNLVRAKRVQPGSLSVTIAWLASSKIQPSDSGAAWLNNLSLAALEGQTVRARFIVVELAPNSNIDEATASELVKLAILSSLGSQLVTVRPLAITPEETARLLGVPVSDIEAEIKNLREEVQLAREMIVKTALLQGECVCHFEDGLVQEWISKARTVAISKGWQPK